LFIFAGKSPPYSTVVLERIDTDCDSGYRSREGSQDDHCGVTQTADDSLSMNENLTSYFPPDQKKLFSPDSCSSPADVPGSEHSVTSRASPRHHCDANAASDGADLEAASSETEDFDDSLIYTDSLTNDSVSCWNAFDIGLEDFEHVEPLSPEAKAIFDSLFEPA